MTGVTVELPRRMLSQHSDAILKATTRIERTPGPITIDATGCEFFGPLGVALLCQALTRRHLNGHVPGALRWPTKAEAAEYLRSIGFERFVRGTEAEPQDPVPSAPGNFYIRQLTGLDVVYIRRLAQLLADRVPGTSETVAHFVELCLNELIQNVVEHAHSPVGCFVQAQWYRQEGNVRIAVVDGGIGIPAALRRRAVQGMQRKSDAEVLVAAVTQVGLTSRTGRPGGLGLKLIREIVVDRSGYLLIVSKGAKVVFDSGGQSVPRTTAPHFEGTAIEFDFRPGQEVASSDEVF